MKPRLFWKILFAFWLTLALATAGVVLAFAVQTHFGRDIQDIFAQQRAERVRAATVALHYGGQPALGQVTAAWPADERSRLRITRLANGATQLTLSPHTPKGFFPIWPIVVQIIAGLVFSAALARYLARPIKQLRDGFRRLAGGELQIRLSPGMGGRHDEIADLVHDFDIMAERLQHLIASRDRLLHDVSHELRSPLARLSLAVALARQSGRVDEQALSRIEMEGERLNTIVGDLLSLSRAENEGAAEIIYFDLASLLQMVCDDASFEAQPRGVAVNLTLAAELADPASAPLLTGTPELLRRAVENVIRNALRFSAPNQAVEVGAGIKDGQIVIDVRDHGPGVPASLLESIFDPFVKGAGETRGVGLGLSIARRALIAHHGAVEAFNLPDGGLLMRLTLPAQQDAAVALA